MNPWDQHLFDAIHDLCGIPRGTHDKAMGHLLDARDNEEMAMFKAQIDRLKGKIERMKGGKNDRN